MQQLVAVGWMCLHYVSGSHIQLFFIWKIMTIKELYQLLILLPEEMEVVIQKDGNKLSPLVGGDTCEVSVQGQQYGGIPTFPIERVFVLYPTN